MENTKVREYLEKAYEKFDARNVSKAFWLVYAREDLDPSVKEEMEYAYGAFDLVGNSKKEERDVLDEIGWAGAKYGRNIRICGQDGFVSLSELARSLKIFSKMLSARDTFFFYFSGHGNGKELLFSDHTAELASILNVIECLPAKSRIAILDCCYSGVARTESIKTFVDSNPGLRSRFNKYFSFEDYKPEELVRIFEKMCREAGYIVLPEALEKVTICLTEKYETRSENFANAREVRNLFEHAVTRQADRLFGKQSPTDEELSELRVEDILN